MQMICRVCPQPRSLPHTQTSSDLFALSSFSSPEGTEVAHFESSQSAVRCGEGGGKQVRSGNIVCSGSGSRSKWASGKLMVRAGGWGSSPCTLLGASRGSQWKIRGPQELGEPPRSATKEGGDPACCLFQCGLQTRATPIPTSFLPSPQDWAVMCRQAGREAASPNTTSLGRTNVKI